MQIIIDTSNTRIPPLSPILAYELPAPINDQSTEPLSEPDGWLSNEEWRTFFIDMRKMLRASFGSNKNERANIVIIACIEVGVNRGSRIIGVLKQLDFHPQHAGMMLSQGLKNKTWIRSADGVYAIPS